jgi:predicted adenine nucleotide alpha hydrolase (AANH) superfamily ATPase
VGNKKYTASHLISFINDGISSSLLTATPEVAIIRGIIRDGATLSMILSNIQKRYGDHLVKCGFPKQEGSHLARNLRMAPMEIKVLALGAPHQYVVGNLVSQKRTSRERFFRASSLIIKVYSGRAELHDSTLKAFTDCFGMMYHQGKIEDAAGYLIEMDPNIEYACCFPLSASITLQLERRTPVVIKFTGSMATLPDILLKAAVDKGVDIGQICGIAYCDHNFYDSNGSNSVLLFARSKLYGINFWGCHRSISTTGNDLPCDHEFSKENWDKLMLAYLEFFAFNQQKKIPRLTDFINSPFFYGSHPKGTFSRTTNVKGYGTTLYPVEDHLEFPHQSQSVMPKQTYASAVMDVGSGNALSTKSVMEENMMLKKQLFEVNSKIDSMLKQMEQQLLANALLQAQVQSLTVAPNSGEEEP